jgi:hypothetical protein
MSKLHYKVVNVVDGKLLSFATPVLSSDVAQFACIEYKPDQWTRPKVPNSKLFVFSDQASAACMFGFHRDIYQIWSCKVKNPSFITARLLVNLIGNATALKDFWLGEGFKTLPDPTDYYHTYCPKNTVVCDAVMLLDRVY